MKVAMLLAAGRGERMKPLTDNVPKPLLKVKGKALIVRHIERLQRAGFEHIVINHAWLGSQLVETLGNGSRFGVNLHYSAEAIALETAGGIVQALPKIHKLLGKDQSFLVVNGDIFCDIDFHAIPLNLEQQLAHLVMIKNPEHNPKGDFALASDGWMSNQTDNKLTFSGVAVYQVKLFDELTPGKRPLAPVLRDAIEAHQVTGQEHKGYWFDIGTPQRLKMINNMELG